MRVAQNLSIVSAYRNLSLARRDFQDCFAKLSSSLKVDTSTGTGGEPGGDANGHRPPALISGPYSQGQTVDVVL